MNCTASFKVSLIFLVCVQLTLFPENKHFNFYKTKPLLTVFPTDDRPLALLCTHNQACFIFGVKEPFYNVFLLNYLIRMYRHEYHNTYQGPIFTY